MIIVKRNPLGDKEVIEVAPGRKVSGYLLSYDSLPGLETDVYVNNELIDIDNDDDMSRVLKEGDILTIHYRPGVVAAIVAAVVSVLVLVALQEKPETPNSAGSTNSSSNNSVSAQTNTIRKYEGVPNICGRVWSYPDLISNAVPEWINNRKQVRELFLIGEGEYQIDQIRDGTTDIDDIQESSATAYGPGTYPSDLLRVDFNDSVNDEELPAPDDPGLVYVGDVAYDDTLFGSAMVTTQNIIFSDSNTITIEQYSWYSYANRFTFVGLLPEIGETIIMADGSGTSVNIGGAQKNYTVTGVSDDGVNVTISVAENTVSETIAGSDPYFDGVFLNVNRAWLEVFQTTSVGQDLDLGPGVEIRTGSWGNFFVGGYRYSSYFNKTYIILAHDEPANSAFDNEYTTIERVTGSGSVNQVGPFTMPSTADGIWFNITARNGLQSDSGGQITVNANFFAQEIDSAGNDVGSPVSTTVSLTGKTTSQIGKTVKLSGLGGKRYKVYAERTTNRYSGSAIQDIFWEEVFTVNSYDGSNFGDVTVLDVVTKAASNRTTSSRKINADVTRKIDGVATTNFADYVKYFITERGGRPESEINTTELYDIADSLTDNMKEFSFTFDDKDISLGQVVKTICDVARVKAYRDGQEWRFTREESKPRTYVFNRRNLASGDNQKQTLQTRMPQDFDSISLRYYDRSLEDYNQVYVKVDFNTQSFIVGEQGDKPSEIELAGCANYAQALNRANLEARRLVYQRKGVEDTALIDASNVDIGERVSWCDVYDGDIFDGEIVSQDGTTLYTSEPFTPESGITYYAMVTDENGDAMTPVVATAGPVPKSFTATLPSSVLLADGLNVQAGSKYIIGSIDDIDLTDYIVMGRGGNSGDGRISLELLQYDERLYEAD